MKRKCSRIFTVTVRSVAERLQNKGVNVAVCFETDISVFRQTAFYVLKRPVLVVASEVSGECQRVVSGEGVSPSLSPRRLRAKYTLRTNLRFMLWGISPCRGKIHAGMDLQSERAGLYLSMPPQRMGRMDAVATNGYILGQIHSNIYGTLQKVLSAAVRKRKEKGICEKKFIYRNGKAS